MTLKRLLVLFATQGVATGLLLPFLVPILYDQGLRPEVIGLLLGLSAAITLGAYPAWGILADTRLGRNRAVQASALIAAAAGCVIALAGPEPALLAAGVCAVSIGAAPWGPISDAIALDVLGAESRDYGRVRRWTSLGWAGAALAGGALYVVLGPAAPPLAFAVASVAVGVAAGRGAGRWSGPSASRGSEAGERLDEASPPGEGVGTGVSSGTSLSALRDLPRLLRSSPVLGPFLLGLFIVSCGGSAAGSFLPLRILDSGGGPFLVGLAAALPAIVEIPFFSGSGAIATRVGLRGLFVIGAAVSALQFAVVAVVPEPWAITTVRTVDGAAFALRYAAIVLIIGACLPERYRAIGQSATWLVAGAIAPIVADPIGGLVYGTLGGTALFAGSALTVAAGAALVYRVLDRPAFRATGSQPAGSAT